jgi:RHS repeat-associated protein
VSLILIVALFAGDPKLEILWTARTDCSPPPANGSSDIIRLTYFSYDFDGHLTQANYPEGVINYEYDLATGRHTRTCTTNSEVAYGYDELGRLKTVQVLKRNGTNLSSPETTTNTYTAVGNRSTVTLPNGIITAYLYDSLNRLTNLTHKLGGTNLLASYSYQLHPTGRRTNAVEILRIPDSEGGGYMTNTLSWAFDQMYRLTNEVSISSVGVTGTYTNAFSYDKVGNRWSRIHYQNGTSTSVTNQFNDNDQLLKEVTLSGGVPNATNSYAYDYNGSVIAKTNISSGGTALALYSYDLKNKMISVAPYNGSWTTNFFAYNCDGIRVRSTMGGSSTLYLIDANNHTGYQQILEELTARGVPATRSYIIGDDVLAQAGTSALYLLYDGHGSTRQLASSSGVITSRYNFEAYGTRLDSSTTVANEIAHNSFTSLLYCGEQFDSTLGMCNLRARYYHPDSGRFNQRDTFAGANSDPASLHKYAYANCDPVNTTDPSGHFGLLDVLSAISIGFTLVTIGIKVYNAYNNLKALDELIQMNLLLNAIDELEPEFLLEFANYSFALANHIIGKLADIGLSIVKEVVGSISSGAALMFMLADGCFGTEEDDGPQGSGAQNGLITTAHLAENEDEYNSDDPIVHLARYARKFEKEAIGVQALTKEGVKMGKGWRFPDFLDHQLGILEECKSVRYLSDSPQLRAYVKWCNQHNYQMIIRLNLRKRPKISSTIQNLWNRGEIAIIQHPL